MLRSIAPTARRSLSASVHPTSPLSSSATSSTSSTSPAAPPPPPPAPPSARPSFMLRALPVAVVSGAGYVAYRASTDNDFRASVTTTFPPAATVIDLLPSPSPPSSSSTSATSVQLRLDEAKPSKSSDAKSKPPVPDAVKRASAILSESSVKSPAPVSTSVPVSVSSSAPTSASTADASPCCDSTHSHSTPSTAMESSLKTTQTSSTSTPTPSTPMHTSSTSAPVATVDPVNRAMSGKEKIARLLGKGDFRASDVRSGDVVNDAEFRRPSSWDDSGSTLEKPSSKSPVPHASRKSKMKAISSSVDSSPSSSTTVTTTTSHSTPTSMVPTTKHALPAQNNPAAQEVDALRAELAGQAKWEAVRLQAAVQAQLVEDRKAAARDAAAVAARHAEELAVEKQHAAEALAKAVEDRGRVVEQRLLAERAAAVDLAVAQRESEVRDTVRAETIKEATVAVRGREEELCRLDARVKALDERFDRVVDAGLALREAGKRAAAAFVLREAVADGKGEGLQVALAKAAGMSAMAKLAADHVPRRAVEEGVASTRMLTEEFAPACRRGLAAAVVPEGRAGSIWAHVLGAVFSRMKVPVDVRLDGDGEARSNEDRIRLAKQLVDEGELSEAVRTLDGLSGLARQVMGEWMDKAKARLAAGLAAEVMMADAIVTQVGLAAE